MCNGYAMPDLLPTSEVARLADVHPSTVTREVARGSLTPALRLKGPAGQLLFSRADVDAWLRTREASA